ncbi:MAG TPA: PDZ domain-containing protein [Polyangia bacterium]|nr:PDZ domain-containing protein [Polyangia bacterium]
MWVLSATMGVYLLAGVLPYFLFIAARAAVAALGRVPGRLPPFGEAPPTDLARQSFSLRLTLTLAGPLAIYLLVTVLSAVAIHSMGVIDGRSMHVDVAPGGPAAEAGMRDGDRIVALAGVPVDEFADLRRLLAPHAGEAIDLLVERDGRNLRLVVTPGPAGSPMAGKIGVSQRPDEPTVAVAIQAGLRRPIDLIAARVAAAGPRVHATLTGPIGLTRAIGRTAQPSRATMVVNVTALLVTVSLESFLLLALFLFPFRRARRAPAGADPVAPGPGRPWRRLAARTVDVAVFFLGLALIAVAINPALPDIIGPSFVLLTIPLEAALLASWGTTPGKALLCVRVRAADGTKLRFGQAVRRAAAVWTFGLGAYQTIGLATGWVAFARLRGQGATYWDAQDGHRVDHEAVAAWRVVLAIVGVVAAVAWMVSIQLRRAMIDF